MSVRLLIGDCRDVLKTLPDESVHCVVTSPPYWRQRDYEMPGQMGLEQTPEEYVAKMTEVFREVRRVIRSEGTCWINIGDKWVSGGNGGGGSFMADRGEAWAHAKNAKSWRNPLAGYKDKDLVGVPFMLAFAMRADGWFWRQCNIWAKPNCMPESVSDRSTISHEYVLQFSKSKDYWYDADAARTPPTLSTETRLAQDVDAQAGSDLANGWAKTNGSMKAVMRKADSTPRNDGDRWNENGGRGLKPRRSDKQRGHTRKHAGFNDRYDQAKRDGTVANGANLRSVWWISPAQYRDGHFAVMPDRLAEICIVAGCPKGGTVLDPFFGVGTTGQVADRLGRNCIGIELNPAYAGMARKRLQSDAGMFSDVQMEASPS